MDHPLPYLSSEEHRLELFHTAHRRVVVNLFEVPPQSNAGDLDLEDASLGDLGEEDMNLGQEAQLLSDFPILESTSAAPPPTTVEPRLHRRLLDGLSAHLLDFLLYLAPFR